MTPETRTFLLEMTQASDVESLWQVHCARMAEYGFDRLLYGFTRFCTESSLGDPNDFVVLSNHCPDYLKGFVDGEL